MSLTLVYYISIILACIMLMFMAWVENKTNEFFCLTLRDLFVGIFLAVCPIINTVVAFCLLCFFVFEYSKTIILFGKMDE
jgi:hypothetical protein